MGVVDEASKLEVTMCIPSTRRSQGSWQRPLRLILLCSHLVTVPSVLSDSLLSSAILEGAGYGTVLACKVHCRTRVVIPAHFVV